MKRHDAEPPKLAVRFLEWFCPPALYEGIEGDLLEQFEADRENGLSARWRFWLNTLRFFRADILLRNRYTLQLINTIMLGNYFKVATRHIQKRKTYSFINAFGLSIGIAFCTLIYLFIQDELNFDSFQENRESIYRIEERSYDTWAEDKDKLYRVSAWVQTALQPVLKQECPEVLYATRYNPDHQGIVRYKEKVFTENVGYVDEDFLRMFSFQWVSGHPDKALADPSHVVITPEIAEKYFGDEDPIGKVLEIENESKKSFTVTGVLNPFPANSSLHFKMLIRQENRPYYQRNVENWGNFNTPTFVQLHAKADTANLRKNLAQLIDKYMGEKLEKWRKEAAKPVPADVKLLSYTFTQLPDVHLKSSVAWEKVSDRKYSLILGGIALLILLIACINYISLALTTSTSRRTEVGIRKAVGAQRKQLVYQFGFESILLAFVSMVIGMGLVALFLPSFNSFTDKSIELNWITITRMIGASALFAIVVGLIAGSYPSLFLSQFKPALVLKGRFTSKLQTGFTRPLVVLQFALSAFLIISSVIMYRQMRYITTKDLGYNGDQVIAVPTRTGWNEEANKTVATFRTRAQQEPSIVKVAGTSDSFNHGYSRWGYKIKGEQKSAFIYVADAEYIPTLDIKLVAGRNFDPSIASDTLGVIVNESLVCDMKWTDPLSEHLNFLEDSTGLGAPVIGVMKDYHYLSLEREVEPMLLSMDKKNVGYLTTMLVKLSSDDVASGLEKVKKIWTELYPDRPFDYTFLDEDVAKQYARYERWANIMGLSTGFAILISCLGLFGLAGVNAVNRTKEVGIRKVMGAELSNIFFLLNKQYIWLSLIAFSIAIPFSWYAMNQWLAGFKFRITMGWEIFALSVLAGVFIALITVSYHALKAALINPAETLKYE
ncbi:MAG: ABC transporter permease [Bacteroidota bacterium]